MDFGSCRSIAFRRMSPKLCIFSFAAPSFNSSVKLEVFLSTQLKYTLCLQPLILKKKNRSIHNVECIRSHNLQMTRTAIKFHLAKN